MPRGSQRLLRHLQTSSNIALPGRTAHVVFVAASSVVHQVEGIVIYAEKFLKKRYAEGREAGSTKTDRLWRDWYTRYLEAQAKGERTPPPPDSEQ